MKRIVSLFIFFERTLKTRVEYIPISFWWCIDRKCTQINGRSAIVVVVFFLLGKNIWFTFILYSELVKTEQKKGANVKKKNSVSPYNILLMHVICVICVNYSNSFFAFLMFCRWMNLVDGRGEKKKLKCSRLQFPFKWLRFKQILWLCNDKDNTGWMISI